MGLLRAIITSAIAFTLVNLIYRNRDLIEKHPIFKKLIPYLDKSKCYLIIFIMIFITILW